MKRVPLELDYYDRVSLKVHTIQWLRPTDTIDEFAIMVYTAGNVSEPFNFERGRTPEELERPIGYDDGKNILHGGWAWIWDKAQPTLRFQRLDPR